MGYSRRRRSQPNSKPKLSNSSPGVSNSLPGVSNSLPGVSNSSQDVPNSSSTTNGNGNLPSIQHLDEHSQIAVQGACKQWYRSQVRLDNSIPIVKSIKSFKLNKSKAIENKLKDLDRCDMEINVTGGGIRVFCSTLMFELLKPTILDYYADDGRSIDHIDITQDDEGNEYMSCIRIRCPMKKGGTYTYTINLYYTTSSMLVNGTNQEKFFSDLEHIIVKIKNTNSRLRINSEIMKTKLQQYLTDENSLKEKSKGLSRKNKSGQALVAKDSRLKENTYDQDVNDSFWKCPTCSLSSETDSIGCDVCQNWFHFKCEKIDSKILAPENNPYTCISCRNDQLHHINGIQKSEVINNTDKFSNIEQKTKPIPSINSANSSQKTALVNKTSVDSDGMKPKLVSATLLSVNNTPVDSDSMKPRSLSATLSNANTQQQHGFGKDANTVNSIQQQTLVDCSNNGNNITQQTAAINNRNKISSNQNNNNQPLLINGKNHVSITQQPSSVIDNSRNQVEKVIIVRGQPTNPNESEKIKGLEKKIKQLETMNLKKNNEISFLKEQNTSLQSNTHRLEKSISQLKDSVRIHKDFQNTNSNDKSGKCPQDRLNTNSRENTHSYDRAGCHKNHTNEHPNQTYNENTNINQHVPHNTTNNQHVPQNTTNINPNINQNRHYCSQQMNGCEFGNVNIPHTPIFPHAFYAQQYQFNPYLFNHYQHQFPQGMNPFYQNQFNCMPLVQNYNILHQQNIALQTAVRTLALRLDNLTMQVNMQQCSPNTVHPQAQGSEANNACIFQNDVDTEYINRNTTNTEYINRNNANTECKTLEEIGNPQTTIPKTINDPTNTTTPVSYGDTENTVPKQIGDSPNVHDFTSHVNTTELFNSNINNDKSNSSNPYQAKNTHHSNIQQPSNTDRSTKNPSSLHYQTEIHNLKPGTSVRPHPSTPETNHFLEVGRRPVKPPDNLHLLH